MLHLTVVACIGTFDAPIAPLVIFRGDCNDGQVSWTAARDPNGAEMVACVTKSGWINTFIAVQWLKHFGCATQARANGAPRLLYLDGHSTHISVEFLEAAWQANISICVLPANLSAILQPLDVDFFNPLKMAYHKRLDNYMLGNGTNPVPRGAFWPWFQKAWTATTSQRQIRGAWRKAGLWPANKSILIGFRPQTPLRELATPAIGPKTPCSLRILQSNRSAVRTGHYNAKDALEKAEKRVEVLLCRDAVTLRRLAAVEAAQELNKQVLGKRKRQIYPRGALLNPEHQNSQEFQEQKSASKQRKKGKKRAVTLQQTPTPSYRETSESSEDPLNDW
jgi:hypothetical protein